MTTVRITDAGGGKPSFTQWDVDRVVIVSGVTSQPMLHFANAELKRAIVVPTEETSTGSGKWKADVPNFILQFPLPIVISVFLQPEGGEGQTVATVPFGVRAKPKPQDYTYEENIGYINWVDKSEEVQALIDDIQGKLDRGELKGDKGDTGAQGPAGPSGVYVGTTEPTDPTVEVWLNPDGDPDPGIAAVTVTVDNSTGTPSATATVSGAPENRTIAFAFHNLKGAKGDTGATGATGATGPAGADGADGQDGAPGQDGQDGQDGEDGYSPTVAVTSITGGNRVTITDANGDHVFDVMNGQGGSITVDDTLSDSSTNPVQNKVIKSALDAKGTYSKPSGGIPSSDLASAVQTSLGKADTALQSFTETDPTVPNWAKASSKPSYTASEVGAAPAVAEVTVSDTGSVSQALDAGKIYHFTGALTALTITLNAASSGQLAQYHFDFTMPSTAFTPTLTGVTLPSGHTWEASKRYEVDVLNGYGVVCAWASS